MITQMWMYDAILYMYALSLMFYFSDYVKPSRRAKRTGTGLLAFVWIMQSLFFADRIVELQYLPLVTMFETLFFYSWLMVTFSLVSNWFLRVDLLTFFMNVIGFTVLAINLFGYSLMASEVPDWVTRNELLFIHISFAIGSYVAFSISAVFSGMHLFLHQQLKKRQWNQTMKRLPSMDQVEAYAYRAVVLGFPLLILSLAVGIAELVLTSNLWLFLDMKVLLSLVIIAAYSYYLMARKSSSLAGYRLAACNIGAFALVLLNVAMTGASRFH
jgi:HemX protein